jgi:hypothetical protein
MVIELFKQITGFDLELVESCYQDSPASKWKIITNASIYEIFDKIRLVEDEIGFIIQSQISYDDVYIIL